MAYTLRKKGLQRFPIEGAVLIHREPTTREYIRYKDGISVGRHAGGQLTTESTEKEIELANDILYDVEDFKFEKIDGQEDYLTKDTPPSEICHFEEAFGHPITSWKDVIPPSWKTRLVLKVQGLLDEQAKNS